jgi:hypothetical protein
LAAALNSSIHCPKTGLKTCTPSPVLFSGYSTLRGGFWYKGQSFRFKEKAKPNAAISHGETVNVIDRQNNGFPLIISDSAFQRVNNLQYSEHPGCRISDDSRPNGYSSGRTYRQAANSRWCVMSGLARFGIRELHRK